MKITNREAFEWRQEHQEDIAAGVEDFLRRVGRRGSQKSIQNARNALIVFASFEKKLPDEYVKEIKGGRDVYTFLDDYVGWLVEECKLAPNSLKNYLSIAKKFLRFREVDVSNEKVRNKVELPRMYTVTRDRAPTIEEIRKMLINSKLNGSVIITMLASSGMRIGELLSLRVKDVDFTKKPATVRLRPEVTKDRQGRYCFISDEAKYFLLEYLGENVNKPEHHIFVSRHHASPHIGYWNADAIVSRAIRAAGIEEKDDGGRDVIHLHSFRKFFFSQLVPILGREVVEALMGHKEFLDASYRRFTEDQMRAFYLKGMNAVTVMMPHGDPEKIKQDAALEAMRAVATTFGIDPMKVRVEKEKEAGREITAEEEMELIKVEVKKLREPQDDPQMIVKEEELQTYLKDGWQFVSVLPSQKILVRK